MKKTIAASLIAVLSLVGAACSDEDGDGAVVDEEIEQVDEFVEDVADQLEEEVEQADREITD